MVHVHSLCFTAVLWSFVGGRALNVGHQQHASHFRQHAKEAVLSNENSSSKDDRVLVVVLGHGQESRSKGLSATLHRFYVQLGPKNFDCLVYVWNPHMPEPDVPPGCEIKVTPGVFMQFTRLIPEARLQASRYTYLMADDVTLDVPGSAPMDITALRDLASANCLDVLTPAQYGSNYLLLQPHVGVGSGRRVEFSDWQGNLVTPTIVHILARLASSDITGCWGYDSLLFSAVQWWTRRTPRLGVADQMVVNVGKEDVSLTVVNTTAYDTKHHPCGEVKVVNGVIEHTAALKQLAFWNRRYGLADYTIWGDPPPVELLVPAGSLAAISTEACAAMLTPDAA